jgi:3-oxoacyl-[acyl-carrier protein] reductase
MALPLADKVALVTGGSRGIGAAIVRRLALDGASVAFTFHRSLREAEALAEEWKGAAGRTVRAYAADAADPDAMGLLVERVVAEFGRIDILVNNAGTYSQGEIGEIAPEEFRRVIRINVEAVFSLTNAAVRVMGPGSRIVNVSSVLGERAAAPGVGVYNASKFAVTGLSRSWAKDLGKKGILVNAVQPGPIDTDMNPADGEHAEVARRRTALGRFGRAEEVAGAVAFLAGPDATYVTGAVLNVDGGFNA